MSLQLRCDGMRDGGVVTFGLLSSVRDFSVEGVADAQLESKGEGAEPAWSSRLSPDSALSDGSTGSLEQQPDAGRSRSGAITCRRRAGHLLMALCTCFRHGLPESGQLWQPGGGPGRGRSEETL